MFVALVTLTPNKLQYIHSSPEIFIINFCPAFFTFKFCKKCAHLEGKKTQQICARFFNHKSLADLNYFTLNERANNFTSDGEKLIAVCYLQQKL